MACHGLQTSTSRTIGSATYSGDLRDEKRENGRFDLTTDFFFS
jgi:hypothetical protein